MESFFPSFLRLVIVKADMVDQTSMLQHSFFEVRTSRSDFRRIQHTESKLKYYYNSSHHKLP